MSQEYHTLLDYVRRVQRGLYIRRVLQAGVSALIIGLLLLLLGVGVRFLIPSIPALALVYSGVSLLSLLALIMLVMVPALRRVSRRQALTRIEQTYPDLHDDLTNALELDAARLEAANPHGVALELVQALHAKTARQVKSLMPQAVVRRAPLQGLAWCGMLVLAAGAVAVIQPSLLSEALRVMMAPTHYLPERDMRLAVTPQQVTIARGMNLEVQAQAAQRVPRRLELLVKRPGEDDKQYVMESLETGTFRYIFLKPQTGFTFQALSGKFTSAPGTVQVVPAPAVGNITLRYLYPDYTGLRSKTQEGGGDIQALPGTQVRITMQSNVPLSRGRLRLADGNELPLAITDQALQGEILVMEEGAYNIEVEDTHGLHNQQPPWYGIRLTPDLVPTVHLINPNDEREIDETTVLDIRYSVEDDFGLQDAALVYFGTDGVEHRVPLHRGRFTQRQAVEHFSWDLYQHPLPDGETVQIYVEVYDNDTISGPKKGVSETLTMKVRNREQEHQALEAVQNEIADTLLDLLGDHLDLGDALASQREQAAQQDDPKQAPREQIAALQQQSIARAEQVASQIEEALDKVQNDPYSTYETYADMQALQRNMDYLRQNLMPKLQEAMQPMSEMAASTDRQGQTTSALEDVVRELERLAALADNVATSEKMHDLMQLSTKMMEQQNQLLSALDNLPQDFQGGDLPPELQRMMDALDHLMRELANAIAQLPMSMPDEFLNQQLSNLPLTDMMQQLDAIRQKLAEGDLEGAKQLAEQMLKSLSTMVASMQNMMQQSRDGGMDAMAQQLQSSSDALSDLVQRQEAIVDETQTIDHEALQRLNQTQQDAFNAMLKQLEREFSDLSTLVDDLSRRARQHPELGTDFQRAYRDVSKHLHGMRNHLDQHDLPQAREALESAQRQFDWMRGRVARLLTPDAAMQAQIGQGQERLGAIQRRIDNLPQDRHAMLTPPQRDQLGSLGQRQDTVAQETEQLHQAFDHLRPLMPFLPSETVDNLREAIPLMQQAEGELSARRSQPALPPEQAALERLRNAQNNLQQALQQLSQRGQMMGQSMPMLRQAGRLPMPNMMPQPQVDQRQAGVSGASVRNFQLPDKEAYKVPRMYREDIMEALKEGYPERYKELIEQYYRKIVR
jgi:hypothetical protein